MARARRTRRGAGADLKVRPDIPALGRHDKYVMLALDLDNLFVKRDLESISIDHAAVVPQRFKTRWLVVGRHERQTANLQQLRRGEKHHVGREIEDRVDEHALLDEHVIETLLLGGNGGGEAGGPRADDQDVADGHVPKYKLDSGQFKVSWQMARCGWRYLRSKP